MVGFIELRCGGGGGSWWLVVVVRSGGVLTVGGSNQIDLRATGVLSSSTLGPSLYWHYGAMHL